MEKKTLFHNQHPLVKLILTLILMNLALMAGPLQLCLLFCMFMLYLLMSPELILNWLNLSLKFIPLIMVILFFGIVTNENFYHTLLIASRLIFLLMISVYLFKSSTLAQYKKLLPEDKRFQTWLQATLLFIPLFFENYSKARKKTNNLIKIIDISLSETHNSIEDVRAKASEFSSEEHIFSFKADIPAYVCILAAILIFYLTETL